MLCAIFIVDFYTEIRLADASPGMLVYHPFNVWRTRVERSPGEAFSFWLAVTFCMKLGSFQSQALQPCTKSCSLSITTPKTALTLSPMT
jgi:hypothetical protein